MQKRKLGKSNLEVSTLAENPKVVAMKSSLGLPVSTSKGLLDSRTSTGANRIHVAAFPDMPAINDSGTV
jgi:hypothetical protein